MTPEYRRLTRKTRSIAGHTQLWMAPDHLLLVNSSRFAEKYQRFSWADIQAIVISDGPDRIVLQTLAVLGSITWAAGAFAVDLRLGKWVFALTGLLFLAFAILDIARGPRCRCILHTAVSRKPLLPVSRKRIARRFLAVVMPAIEAEQGALSPPQLAEIAASAEPVNVAPTGVARPRWGAAELLFALFLLDAGMFWIAFRWPLLGAAVILPTAVFGELLLAGTAIVQGRSNPLRISYVLAALTIACVVVDTFTTGRLVWSNLMSSALQGIGPPVMATLLAPTRGAAVFASTWRVAASLIGLTASYFERRGNSPS